MKHIVKQTEPSDFIQWKLDFPTWSVDGRNPDYKDLINPLKNEVKETLMLEQGKICCYCGMRISSKNSHLEHLKPQEQCTPEESIDYYNLVASCEGENKKVHCGHNKANWYEEELFVSPLDANCEQYFMYNFEGEILPNPEPELCEIAKIMIQKLGLDSKTLTILRKQAIDTILLEEEDSIEKIDEYLTLCNTKNEDGEFLEYSAALKYLLQTI